MHPVVADLRAQLGVPAEFEEKTVNIEDGWAFVYGKIVGADGLPFDYGGTPFAEAAANGGRSRTYAGLFRDNGAAWTRVDSAVGPTDLAWDGWAERYGAPAAIFRIPTD
ncbi:uncharacterized protein RMCB_1305 [Mycolicibacterium brisbanense]|uniref:Uncharacterized protein n=1 Tax=Mycolicibacterium brisbanense TaxID=146020 RepID=A0A100VWG1_9MYCO|nr:uncharacterized protein RMCB_1305 [Mycolicibacterium brisbanense]